MKPRLTATQIRDLLAPDAFCRERDITVRGGGIFVEKNNSVELHISEGDLDDGSYKAKFGDWARGVDKREPRKG
jgi:hypothetical protein